MQKAILISKINQDMLASRYSIDAIDKDERVPIGMYLIGDFGDNFSFEIVTPEVYKELFDEVDDIKNGFKAVFRK